MGWLGKWNFNKTSNRRRKEETKRRKTNSKTKGVGSKTSGQERSDEIGSQKIIFVSTFKWPFWCFAVTFYCCDILLCDVHCEMKFFQNKWFFTISVWQCLKITKKKSHSTLRAKRATFTICVDKTSLKNAQNTQFDEFLKTYSLRSNSVTKRVSFKRTKIGENAKT